MESGYLWLDFFLIDLGSWRDRITTTDTFK